MDLVYKCIEFSAKSRPEFETIYLKMKKIQRDITSGGGGGGGFFNFGGAAALGKKNSSKPPQVSTPNPKNNNKLDSQSFMATNSSYVTSSLYSSNFIGGSTKSQIKYVSNMTSRRRSLLLGLLVCLLLAGIAGGVTGYLVLQSKKV